MSILFPSCALKPKQTSIPHTFIEQLDAVIPDLLHHYEIPGAAVAIIHKGHVQWKQGYGFADGDKKTPVTPETVFQAASISKPVTAWGVLNLVEKGVLELDVPIEQYTRRWRLPPSSFDHDEITIRRLLSHTAGLSLKGYPGFGPGQPLPSLEASLSGATGGAGDVRVEFRPGSAFSYSGGGYTLLQLIIEEVTGKPFSVYMEREIFTPLGMLRSSFEWSPDIQPLTSTAFDVEGNPLPNFLFTARAAAGLYSTVSDLAQFIKHGMSGMKNRYPAQQLLSPDTLAMMFSPHVQVSEDESFGYRSYGLGYMTDRLPDGTGVIAHTGSNRGWRSHFAALPEKGEGIVILTNSDMGNNLIRDILRMWTSWIDVDNSGFCR